MHLGWHRSEPGNAATVDVSCHGQSPGERSFGYSLFIDRTFYSSHAVTSAHPVRFGPQRKSASDNEKIITARLLMGRECLLFAAADERGEGVVPSSTMDTGVNVACLFAPGRRPRFAFLRSKERIDRHIERKGNMIRIPMGFTLLLCSVSQLAAQIGATDPLEYSFSGGYGQVEVGGRFAGAEFHDSRPLPSRISLYYPVANSIDLSADCWKRGDSRSMAVGMCVDGGPVQWIGREPWPYILSPHRVTFSRSVDGLAYSMRYEFGLQQAFMVFRLTVRNASSLSRRVAEYVHLKPSLRTCHTYARFDSAWVSYDSTTMASFVRFDEPQTAGACVIVENAGEHPAGWAIDASRFSVTDSGTSSWRGPSSLPRLDARKESRRPALASFTYSKLLGSGDSLVVVLLIGTCKQDEAEAFAGIWSEKWKEDVSAFNAFILMKAVHGGKLATGDSWVDRSILWSNTLLAAYAHYLDGVVVPMPCPAEYNFFFTHDMLLTDLAAIAFDPERVRRDLTYLSAHARDSVIPHAYYWKDDGFKTEICPLDDWNHLWFVLTAGTYLRHAKDTTFGKRIEALVTKSMLEALHRLQPDHLMHAQAPDWWI